MTHRLEMGELAAAHDADHGAGQLGGLGVATQRLADVRSCAEDRPTLSGSARGRAGAGMANLIGGGEFAQRIMRDVVRGRAQ